MGFNNGPKGTMYRSHTCSISYFNVVFRTYSIQYVILRNLWCTFGMVREILLL